MGRRGAAWGRVREEEWWSGEGGMRQEQGFGVALNTVCLRTGKSGENGGWGSGGVVGGKGRGGGKGGGAGEARVGLDILKSTF